MSRKKRRVRRRYRTLGELEMQAPPPVMMMPKPYSKDTMRWLKRELHKDLSRCRIDGRMLREGMEVEREHGRGVKETAKIAIDHLCERGDYYKVLKRVGL